MSRWQDQNKSKEIILHPNRSLDWAAVCHRMLQMLKIYLTSKITKQNSWEKNLLTTIKYKDTSDSGSLTHKKMSEVEEIF